jgi:hypothetical protein
MTTLALGRKLVTLINVFTVEPATQQQLIELLTQAARTSVRHAPESRTLALSAASARSEIRSWNV